MKFLIPMRGRKIFSSVLIMMVLLAIPSLISAQNQKVKLTGKNITLKVAFEQIEKQTGLSIDYNANVIDANRLIDKLPKQGTLTTILNQILNGTEYTYTINKSHVIINVPPKRTAQLSAEEPHSTKNIVGVVIDTHGEPIIGANIFEKTTKTGTITDMYGKFSLNVPEQSTIQISYIGYIPKEVKVENQHNFIIKLNENDKALNEVVVVGYGTMRKSDLTGAITSVKSSELPVSTSTLEQALIGHTPGVEIKQTSGAPGAGTNIRVRGVNSIYASVGPLYVIDGHPETKDVYINPSDVESVEVLKDAASAAIYGSRAAGGVVIITTKRGSTAKPVIQYDFQYSEQQLSKKIDLLNAEEYRDFVINARNNSYKDFCDNNGLDYNPYDDNETRASKGAVNATFIAPIFFDFETNTPVDSPYDTDWQDAIFNTTPMQKHNISVRGGNDVFKYMASIGYIAQEGILSPSYNNRLTSRLNMDIQANKKMKIGVNFSTNYTNNREVQTATPAWSDGIILTALSFAPQFPVYNSDGSVAFGLQHQMADYSATSGENPVALAYEIQDYNDLYKTDLGANIDYNILPELLFRVNGGLLLSSSENRYYHPASVGSTASEIGDYAVLSRASRSKNSSIDWLTEYTLNYNKTWNKHGINILAGYSMQRQTYDNFSASAKGFEDDRITEFSAHGAAANGNIYEATSSRPAWSLMSYFGRILYTYNDRYILTGSLRTDGCSRFGPDNRWGKFPSVAVGWNVFNERFFKDRIHNTQLKLRASYGISGNNNIGNYDYIALISKGVGTFGSGSSESVVTTAYSGGFTDSKLGWEKTKQINYGFDLGLLDNRISLIANYYSSLTTDLLYKKQISSITGSTSFKTNLDAKVINKGFDLQLDSRILTGDFKWNLGCNISFNKNKVKDLPETIISKAERNAVSHITMSGEPLGSFYGLVSQGIITESDYQNILIDKSNFINGSFPENYELKGPPVWDYNSVKPGDVKWKDFDGNGIITDDDRDIIGDNYPDFTYGFSTNFSYKNFELTSTFSGSKGASVINFTKYYLWNMEGGNNQYASVKNRYIDANNVGDGMTYRANRAITNKNTQGVSSYQVEDASYFRCSNITLGYTIPDIISSFIGISGANIYFSVDNLFTLSKYIGYNPDVDYKSGNLTPGIDWGTYPLSKVYSIGLKLKF